MGFQNLGQLANQLANQAPAPTVQANGPAADWWSQNAPTNTGVTGGMLPGQLPGGSPSADPNALIAQWKQTHPASNPDLPGLVQFLNQHGLAATQATHANGTQLSDDKIILNGGMWDLGSSFGGPGGSWFDTPQVDYNDPNAGGSGGGGDFGSLAQGWNQSFTAPTMDEFMNSPGIQAGLKMGQQALERSAASKGTLLTGGLMKDLNSFAGDYASQKYGDVYGRALGEYGLAQNTFYKNQDNLFNRNFSLAQLGQNSATNTGLQGQNNANAQSGLYTDQGNAQAAGTVGGANAWMPTIGSLANAGVDYLAARNGSSY